MKVLFLDFDGVLTSRKSCAEYGTFRALDPAAVELLNGIIENTNAYVVISSCWRIRNSVDMLRHILSEFGFRYSGRVLGMTPRVMGERGEEITAWLAAFEGDVEKFVVLDDEPSDLKCVLPYVVQTNFDCGLTVVEARHVTSALA